MLPATAATAELNRYFSLKPDGWRTEDWDVFTHIHRDILQDYLEKLIPPISTLSSKRAVLELITASIPSNREVESLSKALLKAWRGHKFHKGARPDIYYN